MKEQEIYDVSIKIEEQGEEGGIEVSSFTCEICLNLVSFKKKFKNEIKCPTHSYCIEKHVQAKLEEHNLAEIKCPALDCNELLDIFVCREMLSPQMIVRWCDVLCGSTVSRYPHVYCPFENCSALILNECEDNLTKSACPMCKILICFAYRNDILFGTLMEHNKWQRCPVCRQCVERGIGCKIITCRCGNEFCYLCGRKVTTHLCSCKVELHDVCNIVFLVILALLFIAVIVGIIFLVRFIVRKAKS
ncbi:hypothetical protein AQUCO_01300929v1 [Aquilegia coerulea]|uniref:RING-type domain-containing protein n=1 Tax=Aquilegia coerulea TaxID=218851 RepID=A0A2G5E493_AQUCA|nr:hypothetical protein AQUCO_01300929v1 [Aquilegia coerulea]